MQGSKSCQFPGRSQVFGALQPGLADIPAPVWSQDVMFIFPEPAP